MLSYDVLWSIVYVASCHLEILGAPITMKGRLWEVSFTDLAIYAILLGITTEVMRLNMLKLSLCLMTYYSGPYIIQTVEMIVLLE